MHILLARKCFIFKHLLDRSCLFLETLRKQAVSAFALLQPHSIDHCQHAQKRCRNSTSGGYATVKRCKFPSCGIVINKTSLWKSAAAVYTRTFVFMFPSCFCFLHGAMESMCRQKINPQYSYVVELQAVVHNEQRQQSNDTCRRLDAVGYIERWNANTTHSRQQFINEAHLAARLSFCRLPP